MVGTALYLAQVCLANKKKEKRPNHGIGHGRYNAKENTE